MGNTEHYTSDKPINTENEDRFQRYGFAKRIAETIPILSRNNKDSIVLGLFGASYLVLEEIPKWDKSCSNSKAFIAFSLITVLMRFF